MRNRFLAPLGEVAGLALGLWLFSRLHASVAQDYARATTNARHLIDAERALHLDVEPAANRWLADRPGLIPVAVSYYRLYYALLLGSLIWVRLRRPDHYLQVRRTLAVMLVLVLPVFWFFPLSPPRFALPGIVDIVADHDIFGSHGAPAGARQSYTAMPSLHTAWSLWCGYALWSGLRPSRPQIAMLAWVIPLLMVAVVLTTGNHYVLDLVGSAVLVAASVAGAVLWTRAGERWFRPGRAPRRPGAAASSPSRPRSDRTE